MKPRTAIYIGVLAICSIFGPPSRIASAQHITIDGRFSPAQTLVGPNYLIGAGLGKQVGGNLFHSFGQFSLSKTPAPESATFTSTGSTGPISNVIGRVTGGNQSSIDGAINSKIPGANLYLINPSGIVFGPNATVNVSGSFHASTADYINMSDGARFQATNPGGSTLSSAPPAGFGFLNALPARITVNGSSLEVTSGQTLGLVGGPVSIQGGALSAPGGTIRVTSVSGPGEVPAAKRIGSKPTVTGYGPVDIANSSRLDVSGPVSGGSVFIRAGALTIDGSQINGDNLGSGSGGRLVLRADGDITLSGGATVHADAYGSGTGGVISVKARNLSISNALIESFTQPGLTQNSSTGNGGDISVKVTDALSIDGGSGMPLKTGIQTQALQGTTGTPGNITVSAGNLSIVNAGTILTNTVTLANAGSILVNTGALYLQRVGQIDSETNGRGAAGAVTVNAATAGISDIGEINAVTFGSGDAGAVHVSISGNLTIVGPSNGDIGHLTGIGTVADPGSTGNAGRVTVNAGSLTIGGLLGQISSSTLSSGKGGDVSVNVVGPVSITGPRGFYPTGIVTGAFPDIVGEKSTGRAGSVAVTAGSLSIVDGGEISSTTVGPGAAGNVSVNIAGLLSIASPRDISPTGILAVAFPGSAGTAGSVTVNAGSLSIVDGGEISSTTFGTGAGGSVSVMTPGPLLLDGKGQIAASAEDPRSGPGGSVMVNAGTLTIKDGAQIASTTAGPGDGGTVQVVAQGPLTLTDPATRITATSTANGNAGSVMVGAPQIAITGGAEIASTTAGLGNGGSVMVTTPGALLLDGMGVGGTRIAASADQGALGAAGELTVNAGSLTVQGGAQIASSTAGSGKGGNVGVTVANGVTLSGAGPGGPSRITASAGQDSSGQAGDVVLTAGGAIALLGGGQISSETGGSGNGGTVQVSAQGPLTVSDPMSDIVASTTSSGHAGSVAVTAPQITLASGGAIASTTAGTGAGGSVNVATPGALILNGFSDPNTQIAASATGTQSGGGGFVMVDAGTLRVQGGAQIASTTAGLGDGGLVQVTAHGPLTLSDPGSGIVASTTSRGNAGSVTVTAPQITIASGGEIASTTAGTGMGGPVDVTTPGALVLDGMGVGGTQIAASAFGTSSGAGGRVTVDAGSLTVQGGAQIASTTTGPGRSGDVSVMVTNGVSLSGAGPAGPSGITASAGQDSSGQAGDVVLTAGGAIALLGGGQISSETGGSGNGGTVQVSAQGPLTVSDPMSDIVASTTSSGHAGSVAVTAPQITLASGGAIASTTAGTGAGGSVNVATPGALILNGFSDPNTQIAASATGTQSGGGGFVMVDAGTLRVQGGAQIASTTAGLGDGGLVQVTAHGPLTLSDPGSGIVASTTSRGNAGSVTVTAPQITIASGGEIASTTAGTGMGGPVDVTTPGALVLDGMGVGGTQIAASAFGTSSGAGGRVTVDAGSLTVQGGAQIASTTAGAGNGGNVSVNVASDISLPDPGPQITARSTGSGDAGSVTVTAVRLLMNNGAAISTEAEASTANGGNIMLKVHDFLYLVSSKITTSVKGETGNGGNIAIDPQFVVLNHSSITAEAIEGHGGDIIINAGEYIASTDSIVSATSQKGISGTVEIGGPRVDVNGALVVLSSELRSAAEVLRHSCATQATQPQSSLVEAGRGGLPQDPEATLPALYFVGRDVNPNPQAAAGTPEAKSALQTRAHLTMHCG